MSVLDHLWTVPGVYWGLGQGPNSEFVSRVAVVAHDDRSVTIDYEAWSEAEGLQHAEAMRLARTAEDSDQVVLTATSDGGDDTMTFREGESGVFGSTGRDRVGLVLLPGPGRLAFSWWWPDENGVLSQQSHAELRQLRPIVPAPPSPLSGHDEDADHPAGRAQTVETADDAPTGSIHRSSRPEDDDDLAPDGDGDGGAAGSGDDDAVITVDTAGTGVDVVPGDAVPGDAAAEGGDRPSATDRAAGTADAEGASVADVPWPGIVVLSGNGTGVVAQRLAERLSRAAIVRTDLFDRAVRGSDRVDADPVLRHRIAVAVAHGYARSGHPVILHGASGRTDQIALVDELVQAGLGPVRLVEVADGEDYGEVARRLIDGD